MIEVRRATSDADWQACKAIRFAVFVDEQQVPSALELDALDAGARHWLAMDGERPVGTARAVTLPDGWKVGRVAVLGELRGQGVGNALMRVIASEARLAGARKLMLESQVHAMPFYAKLGYVPEGDEFLEAGIPHRKMVLALD
ncbi:MAG: family N-acetyltransferase [Cyanobacteria bacterium RYN_339]|nr:family N-acetyltransferase [Cyanobacteria bacterium RYN_339]